MVRDGCTVIIGGLIQQQLGTTGNQIPFLGNLKYIGPLFRNRTETTTRNEILILLTRGSFAPRTPTAKDGKRRASPSGARAFMPIRCRRWAGVPSPAAYLRMAQNAQAEGQPGRALRFAELAVQFDPLSLEAIELRNQLCQNGKVCPVERTAGATACRSDGPGPTGPRAVALERSRTPAPRRPPSNIPWTRPARTAKGYYLSEETPVIARTSARPPLC